MTDAPPVLPRLSPTTLEDSVHSLLDLPASDSQARKKEGSSVLDYRSSSDALTGASTFGSRLLTETNNVNDFNAWDHVEWDESHITAAHTKIAFHHANPVPPSDLETYSDTLAASHWNDFYITHDDGFFKDRKWINLEFPELIACGAANAGRKVICDIGCAVGNTVFPLLRANENEELVIHALDFSEEAIKVLKRHEEFTSRYVKAGVWDMADPEGPPADIGKQSVDVVVLIFAFSALSPKQWEQAVRNIHYLLKPGGIVLVRDYGRYDLTQLRLKAGRLLQDNFYIRGDKTRMYYFTNEELAELFSEERGFKTTQNAIDKRLLVNRKEDKKMYRAWVQLKAIALA